MDYMYIETPRWIYEHGAQFLRVCPKCGRFVKADKSITFNLRTEQPLKEPNATCKKCGRVEMPFEGWFDELSETD